MTRRAPILTRTALAATLLLASIAGADSPAPGVTLETVHRIEPPAPAAGPTLDEVFKSIQTGGGTGGGLPDLPARPIALAAAGLAGTILALRGWKRRKVRVTKPARTPERLRGDHAKLLREVARATGLSRRALRRLEASATAGGLCSPLVAAICPSVMVERATAARSGIEKSRWAALSRQLAGSRR